MSKRTQKQWQNWYEMDFIHREPHVFCSGFAVLANGSSTLLHMTDVQPQHLRKAFIETLTELAAKDDRVILIVGDVGFSYMEAFKEKFPNQFLNAGIAEQNMMGMAAGMAYAGWKPYVYTMSNFILLRPLEQVRNDICYADARVKLFGVKGGASYKFLGHSHNLADGEEKAILEHLPNLATYFPETEVELKKQMELEYNYQSPAYFSI